MSSTSLVDRYVWAVSRHLPDDTGPDVARELRATLTDTIEGKVAGGLDPESAEREAVTELGDPQVLARDYGGRPNHLIGPRYFQPWLQLVRMLLTVVLPIVVVVVVVVEAFSRDATLGSVIGQGVSTLFVAGMHMLVWPTLLFALVERHSDAVDTESLGVEAWDPDSLGDPAGSDRPVRVGEMLAEVGFGLVVVGLVVWQFRGVGDNALQVLDPDLDGLWQLVIVGLLVLDVVLSFLAWVRGRWTLRLAAVDVLASFASAVVLVWLLLAGRLLTDLPQEVAEVFDVSADWTVPTTPIAVGIVVVCAWEAISSLSRALRSRRTHDRAQ